MAPSGNFRCAGTRPALPWRPMRFFRLAAGVFSLVVVTGALALDRVARTPYIGAIVTDASTGRVLFEERADERGYPASVSKLMTLAVVLDRVEAGQLALDSRVTVSAAAAGIGGSQVYLKQGEVFTVDELLYALMISSANDAAMALALHAAGSRDAFVGLMNEKARALGMTSTVFHSPHGLPPGRGQQPDVSTARDLAILSRALLQRGDVLRYASVRQRQLRAGSAQPFDMTSHNNLLGRLAGCDGLKTGYFSAAGSSIAATARRGGQRVIAVVLGSQGSKARDLKTMELVEKGFLALVGTAGTPAAGTAPVPVAGEIPTIRTDRSAPSPEQSSTPAEPLIKFTRPPLRK